MLVMANLSNCVPFFVLLLLNTPLKALAVQLY